MGSSPADDKDPSGRIERPADRPRRKKRAVETTEAHVLELGALAELMLGVAWCDGAKVAVEIIAIAEQLKEFVETTSLPEHVSYLMERFDPKVFDPEQAVSRLRLAGDEDRLAVLSLLARVAGADRVLHPAEEAYLRRVAGALGLDAANLAIKLG